MNIVVNGPQGSGKSTQAKLIAEKFNSNFIDSGDALRHLKDPELLSLAKMYMDQGLWLPEELYFKIFDSYIVEHYDKAYSFVLTGVPRTVSQIKFLEEHVGIVVDRFINLTVSPEEFWKRMNLRKSQEHRSDDNDELIKSRLKEYEEKTLPVVEYYRSRGKVVDIDGEGSIEEVFSRILVALGE